MITNDELETYDLIEIEKRIDRGDWVDPVEINIVKIWLSKKKTEQAFLDKCEQASISASLNTKKLAILSNIISLLALITSLTNIFLGK